MSKARVVVDEMLSEEPSSAPYSTRREKSRKLAQKRRDTYKQIMDDLTNVCGVEYHSHCVGIRPECVCANKIH